MNASVETLRALIESIQLFRSHAAERGKELKRNVWMQRACFAVVLASLAVQLSVLNSLPWVAALQGAFCMAIFIPQAWMLYRAETLLADFRRLLDGSEKDLIEARATLRKLETP
jgi:hypothetical protein